jgi:hypothetical protein
MVDDQDRLSSNSSDQLHSETSKTKLGQWVITWTPKQFYSLMEYGEMFTCTPCGSIRIMEADIVMDERYAIASHEMLSRS